MMLNICPRSCPPNDGTNLITHAQPTNQPTNQGRNILLLGRPGVGKTTAIRDISCMLANNMAKRTVIVDTSNEIGGDGDVPHPGIGDARRMQVSQMVTQVV